MKPAIFNADMTAAIRADRKTVTRRVVKEPWYIEDEEVSRVSGLAMHRGTDSTDGMPYPDQPYRPGDILYVPEPWKCYAIWDNMGYEVEFPDGEYVGFEFTDPERAQRWAKYLDKPAHQWQSPYFMPREAARLFLRVKGVRVERLHDITEDGAKQEGIQYTDFGTYLPNWKMSIDGGKTFHSSGKALHYPGYHVGQVNSPEQCYPTAKGAFRAIWDSTIKPTDLETYGWVANPWVWVIEFERITKEVAEHG